MPPICAGKMITAIDAQIETRIRQAIKLGDPWALDELKDEICGEDRQLKEIFSKIIGDEYQRQLVAMPRRKMLKIYRECYEEPGDADKDWLLGERRLAIPVLPPV